jgi:3-deoxy-D-manno-octulosonic-acid transferase
LSLFYNIIIELVTFFVFLFGGFHKKVQLGQKGRKESLQILQQNLSPSDKVIWLHCASLGEYEQGLPVFEALKTHYQDHKFVLSFFSPSGYEVRKTNPITDLVVYLPLDKKSTVNSFLNITNPKLVVFVKYDLWPNYLQELKRRHITTVLISALFRPSQPYFKSYGNWFKKLLFTFDHIFTQDLESKKLLNSIGYSSTSVSGDTRFDRVGNQLKTDNKLDFIAKFKDTKTCIVAGSTWPEDDSLLIDYINTGKENTKFIIAPHNIDSSQINSMLKKLQKPTVLYSNYKNEALENKSVFIIDTIGLLTKIYKYADIAYIGGGMGSSGLHNTLEAATFGVPIVIGKNYQKFPEAKAMLTKGGLLSVDSGASLQETLDALVKNPEKRKALGQTNKEYIKNNKGASELVMAEITKLYS